MPSSSTLLSNRTKLEKVRPLRRFSILLVDRNPEELARVRSLLNVYSHQSVTQYDVIGETVSKAEVLPLIDRWQPHLLIVGVDLSQDWQETVSIIKKLQKIHNAPRVLLVGKEEPESNDLFEVMKIGVAGYISREYLSTDLLSAIQRVESRQIYLSQSMLTRFFQAFQAYAKQPEQRCLSLRLSGREQEVLKLLVQGYSNEAIARSLFISIATVKAHFTSIFEKLEVKTRTQAIVRALKQELV